MNTSIQVNSSFGLSRNDNAFLTDLQVLETFSRDKTAYRLCVGEDGHLWNQKRNVDSFTQIFHWVQRFLFEKSFNSPEDRNNYLAVRIAADFSFIDQIGFKTGLGTIDRNKEFPEQFKSAREIGQKALEILKNNPKIFVSRSEPLASMDEANLEKIQEPMPQIESASERLKLQMNRLVEEAARCVLVDPERFQAIIREVTQHYLSFRNENQVGERQDCINFFRDLWSKLEREINANPDNRALKIKLLAFCVDAQSRLDELNATGLEFKSAEENGELSRLSSLFLKRRREILDIMNTPIPLSIADPALYLTTPTTLNSKVIFQLANESLSAKPVNMNQLKRALYLVMNVHITSKDAAEKKRANSIIKQIIDIVMKSPEGPGMLESLKKGALRSIKDPKWKEEFFVLFRTCIANYKNKDLKSLDQSICHILQKPNPPPRKKACTIS